MSPQTSRSHVRLAALAAEERARVLVFPELSLTGYELDLADHLAFIADDPGLSPLVQAATSTSLTLIVGDSERVRVVSATTRRR